ncbi:unnamed protein product, partial [Amoebophrya sp. A120]|eukprot:GSA120T00024687001.1
MQLPTAPGPPGVAAATTGANASNIAGPSKNHSASPAAPLAARTNANTSNYASAGAGGGGQHLFHPPAATSAHTVAAFGQHATATNATAAAHFAAQMYQQATLAAVASTSRGSSSSTQHQGSFLPGGVGSFVPHNLHTISAAMAAGGGGAGAGGHHLLFPGSHQSQQQLHH